MDEVDDRLENWPKIQEKIGSGKRTFIALINIPDDYDEETKDEIDFTLEKFSGSKLPRSVPFSSEEIQIIRACDGSNSVQDIVRQMPDGEFLTLRRIVALWEKAAITPKDERNQIANRTQTKFDKVELMKTVALLGLTIGLFLLASLVEPNPTPETRPPAHIVQSLEIYRHVYGRYPITLTEMENKGWIDAQMARKLNYRIEGSIRYSLQRK